MPPVFTISAIHHQCYPPWISINVHDYFVMVLTHGEVMCMCDYAVDLNTVLDYMFDVYCMCTLGVHYSSLSLLYPAPNKHKSWCIVGYLAVKIRNNGINSLFVACQLHPTDSLASLKCKSCQLFFNIWLKAWITNNCQIKTFCFLSRHWFHPGFFDGGEGLLLEKCMKKIVCKACLFWGSGACPPEKK